MTGNNGGVVSANPASLGRERLYCMTCARWGQHSLAGIRGPFAVWRCDLCGALQLHPIACEPGLVHVQASGEGGEADYNDVEHDDLREGHGLGRSALLTDGSL